mmetsp:Transcript_17590/g.19909  ORF Transcript_17590/g.19909 Transcript_17590/m.19909 type:complete len:406 (-) Transcript_17590:57-1274(-)
MTIGTPVIKKYRKAPQAPKRFKSSYMFFSTVKHKEIRTELIANIEEEGQKIKTTDVAKLVSKAWKALPEEEREQWDEIARQDKARYEIEKLTYTGPWKVPIYAARPQQLPPQTKHYKNNNKKRHNQQRRPPKRPLSAFLLFSNATRSDVKHKYPDVANADIPTILAQMWKDADPYEKQLFVDEQFRLEQQYHQTMLEWERPSNSSSSININNSATTTTRTSSEPLCLTTSMGTNNSSAAYCTNMAATVFDDLSPYSSVSMNSSAGAGTSTGAAGPLSSSTTYNHGGYDPYNQGQYQQQYHHQDQQQQHQQQHQHQQLPQYPHYDHAAAAYNYRNPYYGETQHPSSSYGYPLPTSAGFPVTTATATATNHTSSYDGGYERRRSQQQAYEYEYNAAQAPPVHAPVTA